MKRLIWVSLIWPATKRNKEWNHFHDSNLYRSEGKGFKVSTFYPDIFLVGDRLSNYFSIPKKKQYKLIGLFSEFERYLHDNRLAVFVLWANFWDLRSAMLDLPLPSLLG